MAQLRSSRWWVGLTAVLALAFVVAVYFLGFWEPSSGRASAAAPSPGATESASPSPSASGAVAAPDAAVPLTASILESIAPGWLLTTYDSSSGRYRTAAERAGLATPAPTASAGTRTWDAPGTRHIFVVDRVGTVYRGADLGVSSGLEPRLWLPDGRTVVVARPQASDPTRVVLYDFDILTGSLSEPFDGPGVAPSFAARTPEPSPSPGATPSARPSSEPTPPATTPGDASPVWTGGQVRLAANGDGLLVSDGTTLRQWVLLTLDGRAVAQAVPPITAGTLAEDPKGSVYAVSELVTVTTPKWDDVLLEWVDHKAQYWHTVTFAEVPTADASTNRVDHGSPSTEGRCDPFSWAPDRQLLETCRRGDGTIALYTVAPATDTFVRAAVFRPPASEPFFTVKPDGTRVATGRTVYTIAGDLAWHVPSDEPMPTGIAWSGDEYVAWGDASLAASPGRGAGEIRVRDAFGGRPRFTLTARTGEAGFGPVLGRS